MTELRTKRLLVRPFRATDVAESLAYRNDTEFSKFLPHIPQPFTQQDAEPATRSAMIGYALARAHWGCGLATEAARAVIEWAFDQHALVEIWASTQAENTRSRRVTEKLGMVLDPDTRANGDVLYRLRLAR